MANSKKVKGGKKQVKDLPVRDVETAKARAVTGGGISEIQIVKHLDVASAKF